MRVYLIYLGTAFLAGYAWKDWFPPAAALVLMMAVHDNPDMPREMLGVPGLNLWNFLLLATVPAWLVGRRREGLRWDLPLPAALLFALYVVIVLTGFLRLLLDPGPVEISTADLVGEYFVNPMKYLVPAVMIYDGARTRPRLLISLACVLGVYLFLSLLVLKWVPIADAMSGGDLGNRALRRLDAETGFFRTGLSVMLAGAAWALLAVRGFAGSRLASVGVVAGSVLLAFAMGLTGGRGGYLAWIAVGLVMSLVRWRAALVLAPLVVAGILAVAPGVRERALEGTTGTPGGRGDEGIDTETLSAGRLAVWPYMLDKVGEAPFVGFGRLGYRRSGLHATITAEVDASFPHPHNAYLEWLLDNGWLGMVPMIGLYGLILYCSLSLFADSRHPVFVAAGGVAFAMVFAQLVGGLTGRYWYPNEETVGVWAAVGLMARVYVERSRGGSEG